jgi:hypothetical protein
MHIKIRHLHYCKVLNVTTHVIDPCTLRCDFFENFLNCLIGFKLFFQEKVFRIVLPLNLFLLQLFLGKFILVVGESFVID